jgi:hypothetical protein
MTTPEGTFSGRVNALRPVARVTLDGLADLRRTIELETTLDGFCRRGAARQSR